MEVCLTKYNEEDKLNLLNEWDEGIEGVKNVWQVANTENEPIIFIEYNDNSLFTVIERDSICTKSLTDMLNFINEYWKA